MIHTTDRSGYPVMLIQIAPTRFQSITWFGINARYEILGGK